MLSVPTCHRTRHARGSDRARRVVHGLGAAAEPGNSSEATASWVARRRRGLVPLISWVVTPPPLFCRIRSLRGARRPGRHGNRCARLTSILAPPQAAEHAAGARHVSIANPRSEPFHRRQAGRARPKAKRAPTRSRPCGRGAVPTDLDVLRCLARAIETARPPRGYTDDQVSSLRVRSRVPPSFQTLLPVSSS